MKKPFNGWLLVVVIALTVLAFGELLMTLAFAPQIAKGLIATPVLAFRVAAHAILAATLATGVMLLLMRFTLARALLIAWSAVTLAVSVLTAVVDQRFNLGCIWPLIPLIYFIQSQQLRAALIR